MNTGALDVVGRGRPSSVRNRDSVIQAIAEWDGMGVQAFLNALEGCSLSTGQDLVVEGRKYPPKPIVARAHGIEHGSNLSCRNFNAGQARQALVALGFEVVSKTDESTAITKGRVAWVIRAWRREDFDPAVEDGFFALNSAYFDSIGDLSGLGADEIRRVVETTFPEAKQSQRDERWRDLKNFIKEIAIGDMVVLYLDPTRTNAERAELGEVTSEYRHAPPRLAQRRLANFKGEVAKLPDPIRSALRAPVSIIKVTDARQIAVMVGAVEEEESVRNDLASLVKRFKQVSGYPNDKDKKNLRGRVEMAERLSPDSLAEADVDSLRRLATSAYGHPGPMSHFHSVLGQEDGAQRVAEALAHLLYGEGEITVRLDETLSGSRAVPGLKIGLLSKALAVVYPDQWLSVYSIGEKGRSGMLKRLGLESPAKGTPGENAVRANELLRETLRPYFESDLWQASRFLYWLFAQEQMVSTKETLETLAASLHVDFDSLRRIEQLLQDKRQVIFYGPPGTGKTYMARRFAEFLSPGGVTKLQFHPSYAYEDFVEGFRPRTDGQNGFRMVNGPLKRAAEAASESPGTIHVLLIDEINRGNIAKIFGELYYLLEYRDEEINLQYSEEPFALPDNLWIIATMNTADRSIALVDAALRRRFHFFPFFPDEPPIAGLLRRWLEKRNPDMLWVADVVDRANSRLEDRHRAIGPSHFLRENLNDDQVSMIWKHSVLPYIAEQYFGEEERVVAFALDRLRRLDVAAATDENVDEGD
jgi:hypothetical protein